MNITNKNALNILACITTAADPMSRKELRELTSLSKTTILSWTKKLAAAGEIFEAGIAGSGCFAIAAKAAPKTSEKVERPANFPWTHAIANDDGSFHVFAVTNCELCTELCEAPNSVTLPATEKAKLEALGTSFLSRRLEELDVSESGEPHCTGCTPEAEEEEAAAPEAAPEESETDLEAALAAACEADTAEAAPEQLEGLRIPQAPEGFRRTCYRAVDGSMSDGIEEAAALLNLSEIPLRGSKVSREGFLSLCLGLDRKATDEEVAGLYLRIFGCEPRSSKRTFQAYRSIDCLINPSAYQAENKPERAPRAARTPRAPSAKKRIAAALAYIATIPNQESDVVIELRKALEG